MAGLTARRRYNKTPQRRKIPGVGAQTYRGTRVNCQITSAILESSPGNTVDITFNKPMVFTGILPGWTAGGGTVLSVAAASDDPTTATVTFSDPLTTPANILIPFEDPSYRDNTGGYLQSGTVVAHTSG